MGTTQSARGPAALLAARRNGPSTPLGLDDWPAELAALYRERWTALVRVAYLLTADREAAEAIVRDAATALRARWVDVDAPRAYLQSAVIGRSRSWLRRQPPGRHPGPEATQTADQGADGLWGALAVLREKERTAIVLRLYADLPDDAIATALGCRPATVGALVERGLTRLHDELEP
jgi:RNA polymerase sigma factor (sigma-70 family)